MLQNVYLITGSNLGDALLNLNIAKTTIQKQIGQVMQESSVYKTQPWGNVNQQDFLNQVLYIQTGLSAKDLMQEILLVESSMGRERIEKWEPRIIDIDILFYGNDVIQLPHLKIPHPLLHERRFVLAPLQEIAPVFMHPVLLQSITQLLESCTDSSKVDKL